MAEFSYNAVNSTGETVSGVVTALDRRNAVAELAGRGIFASELLEKSDAVSEGGFGSILRSSGIFKLGRSKVTGKDVLTLTTQLSTALRAGLPILNAIEIINAQQKKPAMNQLLNQLAAGVSSGKALSDAMAERPEVFSDLYVSMVRVGETGGLLDQTMLQLTSLIARDEKIKSDMKNAAAYPIFVLTIGIASVIIVLTKILPNIVGTLGSESALLPLPTRILMAASDFLLAWGLLVALVVIGVVIAFAKWKKSPGGIRAWDAFKLRIPILGAVLKTIAVGRFARTLGALTQSGITILNALDVVRDTLGNEVLGAEIDKVAAKVKTGESVAEPLAESGMFPPLLVQIVSIGEQTGKLDELLLNAAETFDADADSAVKRFMSVFPALLILLLAMVVAFIIAATLLPIMGMEIGAG